MASRSLNKEQILDAGLQLIYSRGYTATGIQDIADAASVPKGSFYNYFKSKEDFAIEIIKRYADDTVEFLETHLRSGTESPLNRMRTTLNRLAEDMFSDLNGCGCLVGNITQEMGIHSDKIRKATEREFARLEAQFVACLKDAASVGELSNQIDIKTLGSFIYNGWQGALVRSKSEGNGDQLNRFVFFLFDQVLPSLVREGEQNR